jgi:predicted nucleic acid-binding protein
LTLLLDTTVLIDVLRKRNRRPVWLGQLVESGHQLATSAICVGEVHSGMRPGEEVRTQGLLASIPCFPVDAKIAARAGDIRAEWSRKGTTLTLTDMLIAATALEHGLALVTDNRKDFPMPELSVYPLA